MAETTLHLNDLLKLGNINPKDVMLIRHSKADERFKNCLDKSFVKEYTSIQKTGFADGYKYWMIFISDIGTTARYYATYKVDSFEPINKSLMPKDYPNPDEFEQKDVSYFNLHDEGLMPDLKNRLVIDWGKAAISWYQRAENQNKDVLSISSSKFPGYDKVILGFRELADIVNNPSINEDYVSALKSVKAIYLIADTNTGKQYIGGTYGEEGLFGRWSNYIATKHGGNVRMEAYIKENPNGYNTFQFSVLKIFSIHASDNEIREAEKLYKDKLLTRKFGWNDN